MEEQPTYTSEEIASGKKSKLITFILIGIVSIAFVGSALVTLDILNILSVSSIINDTVGKKNISATSNVSGKNFVISGKDNLQKYITKYQLFKENNVTVTTESGEKQRTVKSLQFILVSEPQSGMSRQDTDGNIIFGLGHKYTEGQMHLDILVYYEPTDSQNTPEETSLFLSEYIIAYLYTMTHKIPHNDQSAWQSATKEVVKEVYNNDDRFIEIQ